MKRIVIMPILGLGVVTLLVATSWALPRRNIYSARLKWKERAIPAIASLVENPKWIGEEIGFLENGRSGQDGRLLAERWLSDRMILMESGEWLIYKSHCHKEPPRIVRDICIAKGSDGQWYYTTCHFCVGMTALMMMQDDQPADLAYFIRRYQFRKFDGQSNECLEETKSFPDEP